MSEKIIHHKTCNIEGCSNKFLANGMCSKHYQRAWKYGDPKIIKIAKRGTGSYTSDGYRRIGKNYKNKREHIWIAEDAIGKKLPKGAEVHHVDGDGCNNKNENLVICPNSKYHKLLHTRQRSLDATGSPDNRKCYICKQYDKPENMYLHRTTYRHRECHRNNEANRIRKEKQKPATELYDE